MLWANFGMLWLSPLQIRFTHDSISEHSSQLVGFSFFSTLTATALRPDSAEAQCPEERRIHHNNAPFESGTGLLWFRRSAGLCVKVTVQHQRVAAILKASATSPLLMGI